MRERIRLAIVIDRIHRWNGAGTERHLSQLLESLDRSRFEPAVFTFEPHGHPLPANLNFPVEVIPPGDPQQHRRLLVNLTRRLSEFRPHIVQTFFRDATCFGPVAARLAGVPTVVISKRDVAEPSAWWESICLKILGKNADAWICNSDSVRNWLLAKGFARPAQAEVLPNCVDLAFFRPPSSQEREAAKLALGMAPKNPVLVSVTNLRSVKGLDLIIKAADLLKNQLIGASFVLIGEGPSREDLEAEIRSRGLGSTVSFVGPQPDVRPWLRAADVGLLTSYREGSSNALLEYIAMGLPTVVSDIPPNRELVSGIFFKPGDAQGLANGILKLWSEPELRSELGQRNRTAALPFSIEAFENRVNSFYNRLLGTELRVAANTAPPITQTEPSK